MGFSPGDFVDRHNGRVHWELKDGPRIVLWSAQEERQFISVEGVDNIVAMFEQLQTIAMMLDIA